MSQPSKQTSKNDRERWVLAILAALDPRLADQVRSDLRSRMSEPSAVRLGSGRIVLVGHRASGKSRLLPYIAKLTGRTAVDLDADIERHYGRRLSEWVRTDEPSFRAAERERFSALPSSCVVAVGGGFLSKHADLLEGHCPVLVPLTFETYRERLLADKTRPRLRPELPLEQEIEQIFRDRDSAHQKVRTVSLVDFLASVSRGPL